MLLFYQKKSISDILASMSDKNEKKESLEEIIDSCVNNSSNALESRLCIINKELKRGFDLLSKHPKSVTFFGSARLAPETDPYKKAKSLSEKIANEGYSVITGGGFGIMAAASEGAHQSSTGTSVGINIQLPFEQTINPFLDESMEFHHFFSRKLILSYSAETYIFFPGGFGTLDELFEILTLKQTGKMPNVPIILFGKEFWSPLEDFFKKVLLKDGQKVISDEDINIYTITDSEEEVLEIIKNAPVRTEVSTTMGLG